jgi:hypothetical protein
MAMLLKLYPGMEIQETKAFGEECIISLLAMLM